MNLGISMFWRVFVVHSLFALVLIIALQATPLFANIAYVKWKPSFMFGCFSVLLFVWTAATSNGPLHLAIGDRLNQPQRFWKSFTFGLACVSCVLAILNLVVAYFATTESWVQYKMFVPLIAELVFCLVAAPFLAVRAAKHLSPA